MRVYVTYQTSTAASRAEVMVEVRAWAGTLVWERSLGLV